MIILAISFLMRIIDIDYALPFRISPDEVPSIYGALKMYVTFFFALIFYILSLYMRLPPNKESINEQNLYSANNQIFLNNIGDYIKKQKYIYLVFNSNFAVAKGAGVISILMLKNNGPTTVIKKISR